MKIAVCIKQVPDTSDVRIDPETLTLRREGVESILNPLDLTAIEEAVRIAARHGGSVTALSMGPPSAEESLREALARGADDAVLLTDRFFGGADTWATALTLAEGLKKTGPYDLVLCGKQAIDGDTAQVGPEIAEILGIPHIAFVREVAIVGGDSAEMNATERPSPDGALLVKALTDSGEVTLRAPLPVLLTTVNALNVPRLPSLVDWVRARGQNVHLLKAADLGLMRDHVGLRGSPTKVNRITGVDYDKRAVDLGAHPETAAAKVLEIIADKRSRASSCEDGDDTPARLPAAKAAERVYVIGQQDGGKIVRATREVTAAAYRISCRTNLRISVVFVLPEGNDGHPVNPPEDYSSLPADEVILVAGRSLDSNDHRHAAAALADLIGTENPSMVLGSATLYGRSLLPRLAARLETGLTADCTGLDLDTETGLLIQTRPAFGGNVIASITTPEHRPQMATVRPRAMPLVDFVPETPPVVRHCHFSTTPLRGVVEFIDERWSAGTEGRLADADVVVAGGKGLGGPREFESVISLAERLDAAYGASRAVVDAGWAPYEAQVGQTGRTIQPLVYIAIGISGAVQHLVGMHAAQTIIAVNNDPDAAIFQVADYAFVGDAPAFVEALHVAG